MKITKAKGYAKPSILTAAHTVLHMLDVRWGGKLA